MIAYSILPILDLSVAKMFMWGLQVLACLAEQVSHLKQPHASGLITADTLVFDLQGAQTYQAGLGAILGEASRFPFLHCTLV